MTEPQPDTLDTPRLRILPDGRLDTRNAAVYIGFSRQTLAMWRIDLNNRTRSEM